MEGGTVFCVEPVAWIEGQESHLRALGKLRRLVHEEPAIVNAGFQCHGGKDTTKACNISPPSYSTRRRDD
jgi:hypothetical protein